MRNCAVTLLCPQCGKPFQTIASRKTYCSPKCLREHENEMDRRNNLVRSAISAKQINSQAESGKQLLSISAAARFLGVSRPTIYAYIKEGKLDLKEAQEDLQHAITGDSITNPIELK